MLQRKVQELRSWHSSRETCNFRSGNTRNAFKLVYSQVLFFIAFPKASRSLSKDATYKVEEDLSCTNSFLFLFSCSFFFSSINCDTRNERILKRRELCSRSYVACNFCFLKFLLRYDSKSDYLSWICIWICICMYVFFEKSSRNTRYFFLSIFSWSNKSSIIWILVRFAFSYPTFFRCADFNSFKSRSFIPRKKNCTFLWSSYRKLEHRTFVNNKKI